jgi:hypothetical protein
MTHRLLVTLFVAALPSAALANGGPVAWTDATGGGGIAPTTSTDISLTSERLTLVVEDDARHFRARACYMLSNPKQAQTVKYGVPLLWSTDPFGEEVDTKPGESAAAAAKSIKIRVGGKDHSCTIEGESEVFPNNGALRRGWCVADVTIPKGDVVSLLLTYRGELLFEDLEFSKSALTMFDARRLHYELFPAGHWAGKARRVSISVDLGRFAGLAVFGKDGTRPAPSKKSAARLEWDLRDVDLTKIGALEVHIDADPILTSALLTSWNRGKSATVTRAKASSTLASKAGAYVAANVIDGDGATAWCEGVAGNGAGEWIEISYPEPAEEYCRLQGFAISSGYTKSATTFTANNRLAKITLAECKSGEVFEETSFKTDRSHDRATHLVRPEGDENGDGTGGGHREVAEAAGHADGGDRPDGGRRRQSDSVALALTGSPICKDVGQDAVGGTRLEEQDAVCIQIILELTQGRQIIHDPEGAALGSDDQIALFDLHVINRCHREVSLPPYPRTAVIQRDTEAGLAAGVDEPHT